MKKSADQSRMYFLTNQFEITHSELTTGYNPVSAGGSAHYSVNDQRYDMHYEMEISIVLSGKLERQQGTLTHIADPSALKCYFLAKIGLSSIIFKG